MAAIDNDDDDDDDFIPLSSILSLSALLCPFALSD